MQSAPGLEPEPELSSGSYSCRGGAATVSGEHETAEAAAAAAAAAA
eukprot:SAG22_NODE_7015_length_785_cov_1.361516_1_plen_45_part_01